MRLFGARPKLPVTPEQRCWLDDSFDLLESLFGNAWVRDAPLVLPSEEFFPIKWEETEEWARDAFDRVCHLMHVPTDRVVLQFEDDPWAQLKERQVPLGWTGGAAGTYREVKAADGSQRALIRVKASLVKEPEKMVATMSHELAHVLLLGDGKISREMERMEPFTDLMTVFCGFGCFTANSAHSYRVDNRGWQVSSQGYLSEREYGYALALYARARGEHSPAWGRELKTSVRVFLRDSLAILSHCGS